MHIRIDFVLSGKTQEVLSTPVLDLLKHLDGPTYALVFVTQTDASRNMAAVVASMSQRTQAPEIRDIPLPSHDGGVLAAIEIADDGWNTIWQDIEGDTEISSSPDSRVLIVSDDETFLVDLAHLVAGTGPNDPFFTGLRLLPYTAISITVDNGGVAIGEPMPIGWVPIS